MTAFVEAPGVIRDAGLAPSVTLGARHPAQVWWAITGIGIGTTLMMWLYRFFVKTELTEHA